MMLGGAARSRGEGGAVVRAERGGAERVEVKVEPWGAGRGRMGLGGVGGGGEGSGKG
jgi:hypothetical protein